MNIKKITLLLFVSSMLFFGCKEQPSVTLDNIQKFKGHIFELSSGIISTKEEIKVVLMNPIKDISAPVELDKSFLKVSPKIAGKVMALNDITISFIPSKRFKPNTRYTFELDLGALQEVPEGYNTFVFDNTPLSFHAALMP